jgi:hypothetical protein
MDMLEDAAPQSDQIDQPDACELSPGPPKLDRDLLLLLILCLLTFFVLLSHSCGYAD